MSKWVKADIDFGVPYVELIMTAREAVLHGYNFVTLLDVASNRKWPIDADPQIVEKTRQETLNHFEEEFNKILAKHRPELIGGTVMYAELTYSGFFKVLYFHKSLPRQLMRESGQRPYELSIIPPTNEQEMVGGFDTEFTS